MLPPLPTRDVGWRTALPPATLCPPPMFLGFVGNKSCDFTSFVWVHWNWALSQKNPRFSLSQSGSWDAEGATCWPPHSAGHNLHIHNSKRQLSFSTQILIYHHRYKHLPDFLFAFWCFWSIKCLCGWIVFFPSSLLYVSDGFIPWDQLLFTHPFIYPGF